MESKAAGRRISTRLSTRQDACAEETGRGISPAYCITVAEAQTVSENPVIPVSVKQPDNSVHTTPQIAAKSCQLVTVADSRKKEHTVTQAVGLVCTKSPDQNSSSGSSVTKTKPTSSTTNTGTLTKTVTQTKAVPQQKSATQSKTLPGPSTWAQGQCVNKTLPSASGAQATQSSDSSAQVSAQSGPSQAGITVTTAHIKEQSSQQVSESGSKTGKGNGPATVSRSNCPAVKKANGKEPAENKSCPSVSKSKSVLSENIKTVVSVSEITEIAPQAATVSVKQPPGKSPGQMKPGLSVQSIVKTEKPVTTCHVKTPPQNESDETTPVKPLTTSQANTNTQSQGKSVTVTEQLTPASGNPVITSQGKTLPRGKSVTSTSTKVVSASQDKHQPQDRSVTATPAECVVTSQSRILPQDASENMIVAKPVTRSAKPVTQNKTVTPAKPVATPRSKSVPQRKSVTASLAKAVSASQDKIQPQEGCKTKAKQLTKAAHQVSIQVNQSHSDSAIQTAVQIAAKSSQSVATTDSKTESGRQLVSKSNSKPTTSADQPNTKSTAKPISSNQSNTRSTAKPTAKHTTSAEQPIVKSTAKPTAKPTSSTNQSNTKPTVKPTAKNTTPALQPISKPTAKPTGNPTTSADQPNTKFTAKPTTSSNQSNTKSTAKPTVKPTTSADQPNTKSTAKPNTSSDQPNTKSTAKPNTSSDQPNTKSTAKPNTSSDQSNIKLTAKPTVKPTTSADQPNAKSTAKPTTSADQQNAKSTAKPTTSSDQSNIKSTAKPTAKPKTKADQPNAKSTAKLTTSADQPNTKSTPNQNTAADQPNAKSTANPTASADQPTSKSTANPTTSSNQSSTKSAAKPTTSAEQPTAKSTAKPTTSADQPNTKSIAKPAPLADQPNTKSTAKPTTSADQRNAKSTAKPTTSADQPNAKSIAKPAISADQPNAKSTAKRTTAANQPNAKSTAKPTTSSDQSNIKSTAKPTAKPTTKADQPNAKSTAKPTTAADQPNTKSTAKPTTSADQPNAKSTAKPTAKPTTSADQPNAKFTAKPTTSANQSNTKSTAKPTTSAHQPNAKSTANPTSADQPNTKSTAKSTTSADRPNTKSTAKPTTSSNQSNTKSTAKPTTSADQRNAKSTAKPTTADQPNAKSTSADQPKAKSTAKPTISADQPNAKFTAKPPTSADQSNTKSTAKPTAKPTTSADQPNAKSTAKPTISSDQSNTKCTAKPTAKTTTKADQPNTKFTANQNTAADQPNAKSTANPTASSKSNQSSTKSAAKPTTSAEQPPAKSTTKPTTSADQPNVKSIAKPATSADQPNAKSIAKPPTAADQPNAKSIAKPTTAADQPNTKSTAKLTTSADQPNAKSTAKPTAKPTTSADQPNAKSTAKPTTSADQPNKNSTAKTTISADQSNAKSSTLTTCKSTSCDTVTTHGVQSSSRPMKRSSRALSDCDTAAHTEKSSKRLKIAGKNAITNTVCEASIKNAEKLIHGHGSNLKEQSDETAGQFNTCKPANKSDVKTNKTQVLEHDISELHCKGVCGSSGKASAPSRENQSSGVQLSKSQSQVHIRMSEPSELDTCIFTVNRVSESDIRTPATSSTKVENTTANNPETLSSAQGSSTFEDIVSFSNSCSVIAKTAENMMNTNSPNTHTDEQTEDSGTGEPQGTSRSSANTTKAKFSLDERLTVQNVGICQTKEINNQQQTSTGEETSNDSTSIEREGSYQPFEQLSSQIRQGPWQFSLQLSSITLADFGKTEFQSLFSTAQDYEISVMCHRQSKTSERQYGGSCLYFDRLLPAKCAMQKLVQMQLSRKKLEIQITRQIPNSEDKISVKLVVDKHVMGNLGTDAVSRDSVERRNVFLSNVPQCITREILFVVFPSAYTIQEPENGTTVIQFRSAAAAVEIIQCYTLVSINDSQLKLEQKATTNNKASGGYVQSHKATQNNEKSTEDAEISAQGTSIVAGVVNSETESTTTSGENIGKQKEQDVRHSLETQTKPPALDKTCFFCQHTFRNITKLQQHLRRDCCRRSRLDGSSGNSLVVLSTNSNLSTTSDDCVPVLSPLQQKLLTEAMSTESTQSSAQMESSSCEPQARESSLPGLSKDGSTAEKSSSSELNNDGSTEAGSAHCLEETPSVTPHLQATIVESSVSSQDGHTEGAKHASKQMQSATSQLQTKDSKSSVLREGGRNEKTIIGLLSSEQTSATSQLHSEESSSSVLSNAGSIEEVSMACMNSSKQTLTTTHKPQTNKSSSPILSKDGSIEKEPVKITHSSKQKQNAASEVEAEETSSSVSTKSGSGEEGFSHFSKQMKNITPIGQTKASCFSLLSTDTSIKEVSMANINSSKQTLTATSQPQANKSSSSVLSRDKSIEIIAHSSKQKQNATPEVQVEETSSSVSTKTGSDEEGSLHPSKQMKNTILKGHTNESSFSVLSNNCDTEEGSLESTLSSKQKQNTAPQRQSEKSNSSVLSTDGRTERRSREVMNLSKQAQRESPQLKENEFRSSVSSKSGNSESPKKKLEAEKLGVKMPMLGQPSQPTKKRDLTQPTGNSDHEEEPASKKPKLACPHLPKQSTNTSNSPASRLTTTTAVGTLKHTAQLQDHKTPLPIGHVKSVSRPLLPKPCKARRQSRSLQKRAASGRGMHNMKSPLLKASSGQSGTAACPIVLDGGGDYDLHGTETCPIHLDEDDDHHKYEAIGKMEEDGNQENAVADSSDQLDPGSSSPQLNIENNQEEGAQSQADCENVELREAAVSQSLDEESYGEPDSIIGDGNAGHRDDGEKNALHQEGNSSRWSLSPNAYSSESLSCSSPEGKQSQRCDNNNTVRKLQCGFNPVHLPLDLQYSESSGYLFPDQDIQDSHWRHTGFMSHRDQSPRPFSSQSNRSWTSNEHGSSTYHRSRSPQSQGTSSCTSSRLYNRSYRRSQSPNYFRSRSSKSSLNYTSSRYTIYSRDRSRSRSPRKYRRLSGGGHNTSCRRSRSPRSLFPKSSQTFSRQGSRSDAKSGIPRSRSPIYSPDRTSAGIDNYSGRHSRSRSQSPYSSLHQSCYRQGRRHSRRSQSPRSLSPNCSRHQTSCTKGSNAGRRSRSRTPKTSQNRTLATRGKYSRRRSRSLSPNTIPIQTSTTKNSHFGLCNRSLSPETSQHQASSKQARRSGKRSQSPESPKINQKETDSRQDQTNDVGNQSHSSRSTTTVHGTISQQGTKADTSKQSISPVERQENDETVKYSSETERKDKDVLISEPSSTTPSCSELTPLSPSVSSLITNALFSSSLSDGVPGLDLLLAATASLETGCNTKLTSNDKPSGDSSNDDSLSQTASQETNEDMSRLGELNDQDKRLGKEGQACKQGSSAVVLFEENPVSPHLFEEPCSSEGRPATVEGGQKGVKILTLHGLMNPHQEAGRQPSKVSKSTPRVQNLEPCHPQDDRNPDETVESRRNPEKALGSTDTKPFAQPPGVLGSDELLLARKIALELQALRDSLLPLGSSSSVQKSLAKEK